jgi:hypothetical protein
LSSQVSRLTLVATIYCLPQVSTTIWGWGLGFRVGLVLDF